MSIPARGIALAFVLAVALTGLPGPSAEAQTEVSDALQILKTDEVPTNSDLAVLLSRATPLPDTSTVIVGRSDVFADSLASGVLQGTSPLLLVPPQGPIPDSVNAELSRLAPSRVILLGGTTAIGTIVEDELAGRYTVERRAGQTRIETAIQIAQTDAPQATTAMLARAFPSVDGDPTQAFADTLAAGGLAAERGWPVLLTATESLPASTRQYLEASSITTVEILGGTSAISQAVEDELTGMSITTERVQGDSRFSTAIAVAGKLGAESAADVARVTLVDGQGADAWAGGFAAAAHSALFDAPIVLTAGTTLPPETGTFLSANGPTFAVPTQNLSDPVLTCVTPVAACEAGRVALGLPPAAGVVFAPASATTLTPGQDVAIQVSGTTPPRAFAQDAMIVVDGTCLDQSASQPLADGSFTVTTSSAPPQPCTIQVAVPLENGSTQRSVATYPGGRIVGTVRSATTDEVIAGATVTLSNGATTVTGAVGEFVFADLPGETYTVTTSADGFQPSAPIRIGVAPATDSPATILMSPALQPGEVRVVLSWDDDPSDLDSHLWTPESQPYHLYYATDGNLATCPFAALDIDDTSGFGPETITVTQAVPGRYRYAVHRFAGAQTLSQSTAVVQVFDSSGLIASFAVPLNGTAAEEWWHVFDFDIGAGTLTPVNRLLQTEDMVAPYVLPQAC